MAVVGAFFAIYFADKDAENTTLEKITTTSGWTIRGHFTDGGNTKLFTEITRTEVPANAAVTPLPPFPVTILVKETGDKFEITQTPSELLLSALPAGTKRLTVAFPQFTACETGSTATLCVAVPAQDKKEK